MFDWYGKDWLKLKKQSVALVISIWSDSMNVKNFSSNRNNPIELNTEIMAAIAKRAQVDTLGMWSEALPLFSQFEAFLYDCLGLPKKEGVSDTQMFGQALKSYLENSRRMLIAAELGETPAKVKIWERLQRLSGAIKSYNEGESKCSEAHFKQLFDYILLNHLGDYNYPQKLSTIRKYFYKHSSACKNLVAFDDMDTYSNTSFLTPHINKEELEKCLRTLGGREFEVMDVEFGLGLSRISYTSKAAYLQQKSMPVKEYERLRGAALKKLLGAFENAGMRVITNAN